ncbi:MAG: type II toxin-antitoxin system HicB family antitoxin [Burkholderiaceae bacterium]|nr:type II toxin-antitoxin system HicB family antitoxin [Burkholderiaceae bacterium]
MPKFEVVICWSNADRAYVAEVQQLPGCMAHGCSYREALEQAEQAMAHWLDVAGQVGRLVPPA